MKDMSDFEQVFLPHLNAAYNLARWLTRNAGDADDVVQEAYLRAFRFSGNYQGGDSRAWLLKIVRNTCYTWLKKNRPREIIYELEEDAHAASTADPETILQESVDCSVVKKLLDGLPAPYREIVVMRDIEGLSYKEIATVTELPLGTVMSRLSRARKRLQAEATAMQKEVLT
jgi:RNA polymerase sigma-70 factor (ECF subfamily)